MNHYQTLMPVYVFKQEKKLNVFKKETGITTVFVTHDQEEAMSISDEIVVMNFGVTQQQDIPQKVYTNPNNLFVAKFLGNPPINIVKGEIKENKLYIGNVLFAEKKAADGIYSVGLRPEDFKIDKAGIEVKDADVEVIGRDTMIRFNIGDTPIRALVDSESYNESNKLILTVRGPKIHLFNLESGETVR